ncbi:MAG: Gfo/Idh/MocA family protein [Gaiellaceae bacterium]
MLVGLVGCGRWGKHILRDLRSLECDVLVVARSDESVARAREGSARAVVEAVDELQGVEGVVVASSTETHAGVIHEALAFGVPIFVEKPLCTDPAEAQHLAATAPERLFVMDKWRYHPGVARLAEIARDGRLGEVSGLRTTRVGWGKAHADADTVWHLAPHDLSVALEVLGEVPQAEEAVAQVADGRVLTLHGLLSVGGAWHALEVSERAPVTARRIELHCADGVAVLGGGWDEHVSVYRANGGSEPREERIDARGELPLLAELRAFVGHLRGGPAPRSSAAEGAAVVEAIAELRQLAGAA